MNELHEEIRQTMLALNQENAQPIVEELQCHLANLLDMVRDELQQRLKERSWSEPSIGIAEQSEAPYKSVRIDCGDKKPLTVEELKAGGWFCLDASEELRRMLVWLGVSVAGDYWDDRPMIKYSYKDFGNGSVLRAHIGIDFDRYKQIHRVGNQFFWSDDK